MPVTQSGDKVTATLPNGASVEILLWGATILSWKSPTPTSKVPREHLFLSSKSALDGSKAVRGGIPVVFPFFGPATLEEHKVFPQHGFARNEKWTYDGTAFETHDSISLKFELLPSNDVLSKFPHPFHLEYLVTLSDTELGNKLTVHNPPSATTPLKFQALLHNYLAAPSSSVTISPLTGLTYLDKVTGSERVEGREEIDVATRTDALYKSAPGTYKVEWEGPAGLSIKTTGFPDVVVWNPQAEAGSQMVDMEDKGWEKYVCVEPGLVNGFHEIVPGDIWRGTQLFQPI